ncbi:E3 ubiquitin-protein ligase TRAIP-like isoform X2 [Hylaeus anthracinus]|uniref:E3 ubiquitin-protein ligase TRAIP-like isoform X2 n=1 Tax=Hylaeus anthracinus TaxID=313031 RepID=UPI0023B8B6AE|nr:E3 ubiquitin-protein ligase TRAIP-like isoform X2 [Hylaeus anthracinus]
MNVVCVICSDLLVPSDDVFHTPCGHIFHFVCLTQWLERSKSCPQCREKTTSSKIHRIYFNFSNNDTITEDTCSLQDKIDKLNFQLLLQDKDIKSYSEKTAKLEKQNAGLVKEVRTVETELNAKNSTIYALKEQIKHYKQQSLETDKLRQEVEQLQKKIETYKNVQTILEASMDDIDEMISRTSDPNTLITYISVMKREMQISLDKRRELRNKVKSLQQELTKVSMERNFLSEEHVKRKQLEQDLMACESVTISLQNKLRELGKKKSTHKQLSSLEPGAANQINSDVIDDLNKNKVASTESNIRLRREEPDKEEENQSEIAKHETNSPYLPVKSRGILLVKESSEKRNAMNFNSCGLLKKRRIGQTSTTNGQLNTTITYNGLGGHSKFDEFPNPGIKIKKSKDDIFKIKR